MGTPEDWELVEASIVTHIIKYDLEGMRKLTGIPFPDKELAECGYRGKFTRVSVSDYGVGWAKLTCKRCAEVMVQRFPNSWAARKAQEMLDAWKD